MEETLISFETAKLAKEKGFDIPTYTSYIGNKFHENEDKPNGYDGYDLASEENWNKKDWVFSRDGGSCFGCKLDNIKYFEACSAPTQSLLQKWLRKTHNVHVELRMGNDGKTIWWFCNIKPIDISKPSTHLASTEQKDEPEQALEEGLKEALKLINYTK